MGNNRVRRRKYSQTIVGITTLAVLALAVGAAQASFLNSCTIYCHGIPPRDAARKGNPHFNSQSSAFLGNHRNHLSATPVAADCSNCHKPVALTDFGHENEVIAMANSLKGYSSATIRAKYDKGIFVNQTSIPNLINATCSNVNCHFETKTPAWGSPSFSFPANCNACHGSPPAGSPGAPAGGLAGSHARHDAYFPGTNGCQKCHPGYTGFTHATSAGRPLRVQDYLRDPLNTLETGATYSGTGTNYLPSISNTQVFGSCVNLYCHGARMPGGDTSGSNKTPTWNSTSYLPASLTAAACGTCHGFPPPAVSGHPGGITIPAGFPATATIGSSCGCHANINSAGNSYANIFVNQTLHVNGLFEPAASGHSFPYGGSLHLSAAGTTPWASCTSCHTNTAGGTYPVTSGTAPNCTGCHLNGLRAPSGTSSCWDCHGASAVDGKPNGNTFPNISGNHNIHMLLTGTTCATCHTGGGSGAATHGSSNRIAATPASVKIAFTGQGTAPVWTIASKTCAATNCHGQGTPAWGARTGALVNGFPYSSIQCEKCHGSKTSNPFYSNAIPKVTANSNAKVGAHFMHLTSSTLKISRTIHCNDCHTIPASVTATNHMNGITNFTWSSLASKGGTLIPTYTTTTGVCANVYCHGAGMPGGDTTGTNRAPIWNSTTYLPATIGAGGAACKICHGFPPLPASGHPTLTTAVPATFGNGTVAIGASCNCHANISTTGTIYANIFVNKAQHIDGTLQVSGGHNVPYDNHKADIVAAGGNTACLGCHAMGTAASPYPAAIVGNPPDCMSCHRKAVPLHTGTTAGANCSSCHGLNTGTGVAIGRPVGTAYPDRLGFHGGASDSGHRTSACTVCHSGAGTTSGNNSGINHGKGSTAGPVRNGKPNVVGPMVNGITPTNSAKGVGTPAGGTTCVHGTISSGCSGGGTKSNSW